MEEAKKSNELETVDKYSEKSMKGTIFSVGFVAAVIVATWLWIFEIYMERL